MIIVNRIGDDGVPGQLLYACIDGLLWKVKQIIKEHGTDIKDNEWVYNIASVDHAYGVSKSKRTGNYDNDYINLSFYAAIYGNNLPIVKYLLTSVGNLLTENQYRGIFISACREGYFPIAEYLLLSEVNTNQLYNIERAFVNITIRSPTFAGLSEVCNLLRYHEYLNGISHVDDISNEVRAAIDTGDMHGLSFILVWLGIPANVLDNDAIRHAARVGNLEVVKILAKDPSVDPSDKHNFAIRYAAGNGHLDVVKFLADQPSVDPESALPAAAYHGHLDVVKFMVNVVGINVNVNRLKPLRSAATLEHWHVVKFIAPHVAIESPDNFVKYMSYHCSRRMIKYLLRFDNIRNSLTDHASPIMKEVWNEYVDELVALYGTSLSTKLSQDIFKTIIQEYHV